MPDMPKVLPSGFELHHHQYRIESVLAKGALGAIYKGFDQPLRQPRALKEMLDELGNEVERKQAFQQFAREAELLLNLDHPAIPKAYDFFVENGRTYLTMDYVDGRTLDKVLAQEGQPRGLPEARVRNWALQLCRFLAYLHRQNPPILYRNLKLSSIMLTRENQIKIIDFSIARPAQKQPVRTVIMTMSYAPPEQLKGNPTPQSDVYALGVTLHRLLTRYDAINNQPSVFDFPSVRSIRPEISPAFDQIIGVALQKDPQNRWTSASEMEQAILRLPPL